MPTPPTRLLRNFQSKDYDKLTGGKSGAQVFKGTYKGKSAVLKKYKTRDHEDLFQSSDSAVKKADAYRTRVHGKKKGDGDLAYIRSIRDIYLSIYLQDRELIPTLYEKGFLRIRTEGKPDQYQPYMIVENLGASGFKELLKFKPEDKKNRNEMKFAILQALARALRKKHTAVVGDDGVAVGCHRDMHPGNIFYKFPEKGQGDKAVVKFIDFDLSITDTETLTEDNSCDRKTLSGSTIKQSFGQWNATLAKYLSHFGLVVERIRFLKPFKTRPIFKNDADLYMYAAYFSSYLLNVGGKEKGEVLKDLQGVVQGMKGKKDFLEKIDRILERRLRPFGKLRGPAQPVAGLLARQLKF